MAKFLYSAAMSLDGFISGPRGDMSWMADYLGPNPVVDELINTTGALLVGHRTFGGDDLPSRAGRGGRGIRRRLDRTAVRADTSPPAEPVAGVTFVSDIDTATTKAAVAAADKYVNILGASVAAQCLQAGVLDEVVVLLPILLGDGTRLFDHPDGWTVRLEQVSVTHAASVTNLWYRIVTPWPGPVPAHP